MNIEIKNIKIASNLSEETIAFTADVYVDGKKTAYARNDGQGGSTHYCSYHKPNNDYDLRQAEAYAKSLPSKTENIGGKPFTIESNLELLIDEAIYAKDNEREQKKFQKKLERACETQIVWGVPNSGSFKSIGFISKPKLVDMMQNINGRGAVKKLIDKVKAELKEGEIILNKNIKISLDDTN